MQKDTKFYQVSTLQALSLGYTKPVVTVKELLEHGDTGLGTFEDVNGEMILLDGKCFRATENGAVFEAEVDLGVPFAAAAFFSCDRELKIEGAESVEKLKELLTQTIEEGFGLNSMHLVRIDGEFEKVDARSESGYRAHHISLKEMLSHTQRAFVFEKVKGSLVCVYFPDYMDGVNAAGWHLHFISEDRKKGGHVFDISLKEGVARFCKITKVEIQIPREPAFDTYSLKQASGEEIKSVEQGK